jgi:DNA-binding transcriptional ArsR family regulator
MADKHAKAALFDAFASVASALASGRRAEIVDLLAQGDRSVEEIASETGQSMAATSHHLKVLARSGLARSRRDGRRIYYGLASERVSELWAAVRDVASRHVAEFGVLAGDYLGSRTEIEQVTAFELAERLTRGSVVLLDVRPTPEFLAGHIAGARSAPLDILDDMASTLPRGQVVAYCRGPYCVYADDAVRLLHARGIDARRLDVGYPEWQRAGLPIETAA